MSDFDFEFDSTSATQADRAANTLESAAYVGVFTAASLLVSDLGAKAVELSFRADEGGNATYRIWFKSGDAKGNTPIDRGVSTINAIMGLFGLGTLQGQTGEVTRRRDGKQVKEEGVIYPSLIGKKIGVVNQNELVNGDNGPITRRDAVIFYDAQTRLTYSEKANGDTQAQKVDKVLRGLKDKDSRKIKNTDMAGGMFSSVEEHDTPSL